MPGLLKGDFNGDLEDDMLFFLNGDFGRDFEADLLGLLDGGVKGDFEGNNEILEWGRIDWL